MDNLENALQGNETFELQGQTFNLVGFTKSNFEHFQEVVDEAQSRWDEGEIDRWDHYKMILGAVFEESVEDLDAGEIDGRKAEEIVNDFLPRSVRTFAMLGGF